MGKIEALQIFLDDNKDKIPKPTKGVKTLFDVMKQPHLENVWSNIYAFFFDPTEDHGFGNLFLSTLVELIKEKQYGRDFSEMIDEYINVKTEDSTDDSKRLDIALQSDNYAILIENKVYADLYNNLGTYWKNYPQYEDKHKQGVVLSLYPKAISLEGRGKELDHDPKKWVNITHLELMERVNKNIPQLEPNKYHLLCEEFYTNIKKMTQPINKEQLDFYWSNRDAMNQISQLVNEVESGIKKQIKDAMKAIGYVGSYELSHCKGLYFHKNKTNKGRNNQQCAICVFLKELYSHNPHIVVTVEILSENFIKQCIANQEIGNILKKDYDGKKDWLQITDYITINIDENNIQSVGNIVSNDIMNRKLEVLGKTIDDIYCQLEKIKQ
ncbi:MAG: PD-(D/E)XK nuclease family protein [Rikenellaceae bacterium]